MRHGGCTGCSKAHRNDITGQCRRCMYCDPDWGKPDLNDHKEEGMTIAASQMAALYGPVFGDQPISDPARPYGYMTCDPTGEVRRRGQIDQMAVARKFSARVKTERDAGMARALMGDWVGEPAPLPEPRGLESWTHKSADSPIEKLKDEIYSFCKNALN